MSQTSRRKFLKNSGIIGLGFGGLQTFVAQSLVSCSSPGKKQNLTEVSVTPFKGYGELKADPKGILNLPEGFRYKVIFRQGEQMDDGLISPDKPDGMATFEGPDGKIILIRNHETNPGDPNGPWGEDFSLLSKVPSEKIYDAGNGLNPATGGTSTLVIDEDSLTVEKSYLSLAGTVRNCAGGLTPWGSWITCEESVLKANEELEQDHGYPFEVPASAEILLADPIPLKAMGRFNHEAVAVDPQSGIVYQTEDRHDGLIYRFIPEEKGNLQKGGRLQVLAIKGQKSVDTRNWAKLDLPPFPINQTVEVEWLDIDQVESPEDDLRYRGFEMGAARFARGEGMWYGDKEVYFACTNGGKIEKGQVFRYIPSEFEGQAKETEAPGKLELFAEPNDEEVCQYCDNLTIAPWGDVVLCEDNKKPFIIGITPKGEFYKIAENVGYESEFAGGVFSPSGKTYFVNIQHVGLTVAIQGPWQHV
ncbi:alkaline phosphatase PhoX [Rapidithrix thailandica]|uniref:Alkaline phosphatase PhoX n=1 Tax=Rapidithrix thailandica TaxID=413964 RepID=A0AAW9RXZ9_9BACT